jgi:hypothetical protein
MPADPIRPSTKANSTKRRDWRCYALAVGLLCILAVPVVGQSCMPNQSCMNPRFDLSAYYGGQNITINECIDPNSPSCAWADAVMAPTLPMPQSTSLPAACRQMETQLHFATIPECRGPHSTLQVATCRRAGMPLNATVTKLMRTLPVQPGSTVTLT